MGKFSLMALPYEADALQPVISKDTIGFHHGKHLAAYVNNLNALLPGSGFEEASLEEIVCKASGGILNNAGQILNHELYFRQFASKPTKAEPTGALAEAIKRDFGSFEAFKDEFQKKGATLFGSGWVWLSAGRQTCHHARAECRQSRAERPHALADIRRLGTCLLPRLPESSARSSCCALADN